MPTLDIRAKVAAISKGGLQVKDIAVALKGEKGRYTLNSLAASLGSGGSIKATGSVNMANETCTINNPAAGSTYFFHVRAYSTFSGVNLKATRTP